MVSNNVSSSVVGSGYRLLIYRTNDDGMADRQLTWNQWWPRLFNDPMLQFLEVLAVVAVKILMSTALASWFLVAGQLLLVVADITGSSEIFGNGSPLTFILRALPLVEVLLKGGSIFNSRE